MWILDSVKATELWTKTYILQKYGKYPITIS